MMDIPVDIRVLQSLNGTDGIMGNNDGFQGALRLTPVLALLAVTANLEVRCDGATPAAKVEGSQPWLNPALLPELRAQRLLSAIASLEDKVALALALGVDKLDNDPEASAVLAKYGLSPYARKDGPAGLADGNGISTAFPSGAALAGTFDPELARRYGAALGQEFHGQGYGVACAPVVDILRTWHFGRAGEGLGEDPFLAAALARPVVDGLQSQHVVSVLKHFVGYTQEAGRTGEAGSPSYTGPYAFSGNFVTVSHRALQEIYFPPFKAAVVKGGAGGVMTCFPNINGQWGAENTYNFGMLKEAWGFDGFAIPDYPSFFHPVRCIAAGLDARTNQAFPIATRDSLLQGLREGVISEESLDDVIRRQLVPIWRVGLDQHPPTNQGPDLVRHKQLALEIISGGSVLLKNKGVLPLSPARTLAVIGAQAGPDAHAATLEARVNVNLYGSAYVRPTHLVTPLDALAARAPGRVSYAPGTRGVGGLSSLAPFGGEPALSEGLLRVDASTGRTADGSLRITTEKGGGRGGFLAQYFNTPDLSGAPLAPRVETVIDLAERGRAGVPFPVAGLNPDHQWSVAWKGYLTPATTGSYRFSLTHAGIVQLLINGVLVTGGRSDFGAVEAASVDLVAGVEVPIEVKYSPRCGIAMGLVLPMPFLGTSLGTFLSVGYAAPDQAIPEAVAAAAAADAAVVFVGTREGEGADRDRLGLQSDQDALILAVARRNPRTVVVITSGGPVAMPWIDEVAAVIQMWYPGDYFGTGAAALLYGDANPSGKLPMTFPRDASQGPATARADYPGLNRDGSTGAFGWLEKVQYREGLLVGYRWFDAMDQVPLFPFGHGLSYTSFTYAGIAAERSPEGGLVVKVTITNGGARAGTEVAQVYLGYPRAAGEPPKVLKGFTKVSLAPGATQRVSITLPPDQLQVFEEARETWITPQGDYTVYVGSSSRDIRGTASFRIP